MNIEDFVFEGMDINGKIYRGLLARKGNDWFISNKAHMPFAYQVRPETVVFLPLVAYKAVDAALNMETFKLGRNKEDKI